MSTNQDYPTSSTEPTSSVSSDAAPKTGTSPEETTSTAGGVPPQEEKAETSRPRASSARKASSSKKPLQLKADHRGTRSQRPSDGSQDETAKPLTIRERLLADFVPPGVPLDRSLLPESLFGPLDAAGLGRDDVLPASALITMAGIAAVAGPNITFAETADPKLSEKLSTGTSLRIVMVGERHAGPVMPGAIMAAMYAVENDLVADHEQSVERVASLRRIAAERRRLHDQAARAAAGLGMAPPPTLTEDRPVHAAARPRIILNEGAGSDVLSAAAGGTGVAVVDTRWMKSMLLGANRDKPTADLLNAIALGHAVPVVRPDGRTEMMALPASVVGALTSAECLFLHKAGKDALAATVFVNAAAWPLGAESPGLAALMRQIRSVSLEPVTLRFGSKARQSFATAADTWKTIETQSMAPLSDFVATLPDLTRRFAGVLHLVECTAGDGKLKAEIADATVKRAIAIVGRFVLPTAVAILGPISSEEVERDARTMVGHLRLNTSPEIPIERRRWMRNWQNLMPHRRFEAALKLLLNERLLTPTQGEDGGQWFAAAAEIHKAA